MSEDETYLRSEVNRLNNVIANRDWTIEELKQRCFEMQNVAIELSKQLDTARREAWDAAREFIDKPMIGCEPAIMRFHKFYSFNDWLQSLQSEAKEGE